ncbi:hypothetical protein MNBD_NITROSPINAE04-795 [hydrothermal vent metagenome]|uniref:DUF4340 domain-containing protein n=1 Tax=hydrothermal vent metagenome TaxID=652676 RepID=A0A3B1BXM5_9ZZZZ
MSSVRIFVAFFVLVLLGLGYYYVDIYTAGKKMEEERISSKALNIAANNISTILIKKPGKETILLKKVKDSWEMVEPVSDKADNEAVKSLLNEAENLSIKDVAGKVSDLDLKDFGLADPSVVTFELKNKSGVTLKVGDLNPAGSGYYAIGKSSGDVALAEKAGVENILKGFYDLRDKTLFPFNAGMVAKITLRRGDFKITIVRKSANEGWSIVSPIKADADNMEVDNILRSFDEARVAGFIDEKGADLAQYGLDEPKGEITLSDGGEKLTLLLGAKTERGGRYAKFANKANVTRISDDLLALLPLTVDKLRDRNLVKIDVGAVEKIVMETSAGKLELESYPVDKMSEEDLPPIKGWRIVEPFNEKADSFVVSNFLHDFATAKATRFIGEGDFDFSEYGLDKPDLKITVITDVGEKILKAATKAGRYFAVVDDRDAVAEIDEKVYISLSKGYGSFMDRSLFNVRSDEVYAIEVERMGQLFRASRGDDEYALEKPERRKLAGTAWNRLVWTVLGLKYIEKINVKGSDELALGKPDISILVYNVKSELIERMDIGPLSDKREGFYAKTNNDGDNLYKVEPAFVNERIVLALEGLIKE